MGELGVVLKRFGWKYSAPPPDPASLGVECLSAAEEVAEQVLNCIHPTLESEDERRDVIDYMQRLIKTHVDCEVFPYGSVPLKTYLGDGDIDLTAFRGPNAEESFAHEVLAALQAEEQNENADYQVKDTQFIDAEVKLVKCVVRNFVIDISFNQLGGLSTLCFLEQIDRHVGRNHLFKRSIMLVKTWCYHESRILGALYGLISTYALETLVLYLFHMFHSSLSGPLKVLYRFLEYYSQFDWENYCISLKGPVCKSSFPNLVVKMPENGWNNQMLNEGFLDKCVEMFSVPLGGPEAKPKSFQMKCLNIVDPLKENNNLGRSVHRGNFNRIISAFKFGASKLGKILLHPRDTFSHGISDFFVNTRARYPYRQRSSIQHLAIEFCEEESESLNHLAELSGDYDSHVRSLLYGQLCNGFSVSTRAVQNSPYLPSSNNHYKKPWEIVRQSIPLRHNNFSQTTSRVVSMEQGIYVAADSSFSATSFCSERKQGTGSYISHTNGYMDRPSQRWSRNMASNNCNNSNAYENITHDVKSRRGTGRSVVRCQTAYSVNGYTNGLFKIEFGSVGNLAEEVISRSTIYSGSTEGASLKTQYNDHDEAREGRSSAGAP